MTAPPRAWKAENAGNNASPRFTLPAGVTDGLAIVGIATKDNTPSFSTLPAGAVKLTGPEGNPNGNDALTTFAVPVSAGQIGDLVWGMAAGAIWAIEAAGYTGAEVLDAQTLTNDGTARSTHNQVDADSGTVAPVTVVAIIGGRATQSSQTSQTPFSSAPSGLTIVDQINSAVGGTNNMIAALADGEQTTAGAVTLDTWSSGGNWFTVTAAVVLGPSAPPVQTVQPSATSSSSRSVAAPSVTPGPVTVAPSATSSSSRSVEPVAVAPGPVAVAPAAVTRTPAVSPASVVPGPVTVAPEATASTTRAVAPPRVSLGVAPAQTVRPSPVAATSGVEAPTVSPGAVTVAPTPATVTASVEPVTLTPGPVAVQPAPVPSSARVDPPSVGVPRPPAQTVRPSPVTSTTRSTSSPTIAAGAARVRPAAVPPGSGVERPRLHRGAVTVAPEAVAASPTVAAVRLRAHSTVRPVAVPKSSRISAPRVIVGRVAIRPLAVARAHRVDLPSFGVLVISRPGGGVTTSPADLDLIVRPNAGTVTALADGVTVRPYIGSTGGPQ